MPTLTEASPVLLTAAYRYISNGICVIAIGKDKRALQSWKIYQDRIITNEEAEIQFEHPEAVALAIVCGKSSGNLEIIDIDQKYSIDGSLWNEYSQAIKDNDPELFNRLMIIQTISGGYHIYYSCDIIEGNLKLSNRHTTDDERISAPGDKIRVLIETRGQGGYAVAPPSEGYRKISGNGIPRITTDERDMLLELARSFNQVVEQPAKDQSSQHYNKKEFGLSPFEDYNKRCDIRELLQSHGWTVVREANGKIQFRRPGRDSGTSGDYLIEKQWFSVFTTSSIFQPQRAYLPYAVFAMLECNGDFSEAARKLLSMGYGERRSNNPKVDPAPKQIDFPLEIFPKGIRDFISHQTVPQDALAVGILGAIATGIGNTAELFISNLRRAKSILDMVIVGDSGQGKSPSLHISYSEIAKHDALLTATYKDAYKRYKKEKRTFEDLPKADRNHDNEPVAPVHYQIIINNATMAMIALLLERNPDGCVVMQDELRGLFKKMTDPRADDLEQHLSLYDGRPIRIQRKGGSGTPEQDLVVENPFCGIVGTTQGAFLKEMFGGSNADNGMLYRFLFSFLDSVPPKKPS
ncbi:MAG TPA: DUF3987 domain-containing protein, partial [Puia sp.]|nr:DUF3987 domain-containing protein [Puia sp.]